MYEQDQRALSQADGLLKRACKPVTATVRGWELESRRAALQRVLTPHEMIADCLEVAAPPRQALPETRTLEFNAGTVFRVSSQEQRHCAHVPFIDPVSLVRWPKPMSVPGHLADIDPGADNVC